jgi:hypothetical protein
MEARQAPNRWPRNRRMANLTEIESMSPEETIWNINGLKVSISRTNGEFWVHAGNRLVAKFALHSEAESYVHAFEESHEPTIVEDDDGCHVYVGGHPCLSFATMAEATEFVNAHRGQPVEDYWGWPLEFGRGFSESEARRKMH